jgi:type I restriction enzyme S subunit
MSTDWKKRELNELFSFSSGKSITPGGDGQYPAFGSNGLIGRSEESLFDAGIIIGRVGAYCGSIEISPSPFWASDNTIIALPKECIDLRFAYYLLSNAKLNRHAGGSAQPLLTQATLKPLKFAAPPLIIQRRIASILGAYDELIEANLRRIRLLDEMARRTFEEALRTFRSGGKPGIDAATLIVETLGGDWGDETATSEEPRETRIIRGTDFRRIQAGDFTTAPRRFVSERSFERRSLRPFDLVVENSINAKTRNAGTPILISAGVIEAFGSSVVATSFCRLFRCASPEQAVVLFHFMDRMQRNNEMRQFQVVAANGIANFQSEHFMKRAVIPLSPDMIRPLGQRLLAFVATTFQQQISNLVRQRDLLLPRLISGELSLRNGEREQAAVA